jgi:outer membrane lipoprotein carrier protein
MPALARTLALAAAAAFALAARAEVPADPSKGPAEAAQQAPAAGTKPGPSKAKGSAAPSKAAAAKAGSPEEQARRLAGRVQKYYGRTRDFSAAFAQRYSYLALGRVEEKTGLVQVKKPGLVRWEYQTPEKKLLLLDGKAFWQWVPEDNQVTVKRRVATGELSSAFTFLWGKGDLLAEFTPRLVPVPEGMPAGEGLELSPKKPGGSVQKLVFSVDAKGQVLASQVTDGQGNENRLVFSGAKVDQKLPDALFVFEAPKGAAVQEVP